MGLKNLNPPSKIADSDLPESIMRDIEADNKIAAAIATHVATPDPHQGKRTFNPVAQTQCLSTGTIKENNNSFVNRCGLEVKSSGGATDDAYMSFHIGGVFAFHLGLDKSTNQLAVGGWSLGNVSYPVWHGGFGRPVWESPSDSRLKQNIRPIPSALALLLECKPVSFRYNRFIREKKDFFGSSFQRDKVHYGFLAEDVPLQDLVFQNDGYLGLNYQEFIPFLVRAIQEQQAQIQELQVQVSDLKNGLATDLN
jgi:hypothetical protein